MRDKIDQLALEELEAAAGVYSKAMMSSQEVRNTGPRRWSGKRKLTALRLWVARRRFWKAWHNLPENYRDPRGAYRYIRKLTTPPVSDWTFREVWLLPEYATNQQETREALGGQ